jgi:hypothetical protein
MPATMTSWHSAKKKKSGEGRDPPVTRALVPIGLDINSLRRSARWVSTQHRQVRRFPPISLVLTAMVAC